MRKIIIILLLFSLNNIFFVFSNSEVLYKNVSFFGAIETDKGKLINDYTFRIRNPINKNTIYCKDVSKPRIYKNRINEGVLSLNCTLEDKKEYIYELLDPKGKIIIKDKFIKLKDKDIFTIGKEGYNDIKIGLYSKDLNLSIFSEEYKQIKRNEFEILSKSPDAGNGQELLESGDFYALDITFLCKSNYKKITKISYDIILNNEKIGGGYNKGIYNIYKKEDKGNVIYEDGDKIKKINFDILNSNKNILIDNCNNENSIPNQIIKDKDIEVVKNNTGSIVIKEKEESYKNEVETASGITNSGNYIFNKIIDKEKKEILKKNKNIVIIISLIVIILIIIFITYNIFKYYKKRKF